MSNSDIEQSGTVKGHLPNGANLSGRISNGLSLSGHISIGGAGDFIIRMTLAGDDNGNITVTSCDATVEQIDAAVAAEKKVVVIASYGDFIYELPMLYYIEGYAYYFGAFMNGHNIISYVKKIGGNTSEWQFEMNQIEAESVSYYKAALPSVTDVRGALDELAPKAHMHENKSVLDKFAETDGKPTYDGEALGGDFIIRMTVEGDDEGNFTVTSCDTTVEQIDAAVVAGKRVVLVASLGNKIFELPMLKGVGGNIYYFGIFLDSQMIVSSVVPIDESTSDWVFVVKPIKAESVSYSNVALPSVTDVEEALNEIVPKSHTHSNKDALDKLSVAGGKLQYDGSDVGGIDVTGATVGQTVKISAVDDNGKPTAWEAVDLTIGDKWELLGTLDASTADVLQLEFPSQMRQIIFHSKIVDSAGDLYGPSTKAYRTVSLLTGNWELLNGVNIGMCSHSWGIICKGRLMCEQEFSWYEIAKPSLTSTTSLLYVGPAQRGANYFYLCGNVSGIRFTTVLPNDVENTASGKIKIWGVRA